MTAQPEDIDLRLLGPVRAWRAGDELDLGSARRTAVLTVLALNAGRPVSREHVLAAVWGDDPPASATGNVYTYVSGLRHLLEPGRGRWRSGQVLSSGGGGYCLHVAETQVDVFRFEALREESRRHRSAGDHPAELAALTAALRLWHGDALAGVPGPYAAAQRVRLAELALATAERQATLLIDLDRHNEAIRTLRPLVQAHPHRADLQEMLMTALEGKGLRRDAVTLRDRLGPPVPVPAPSGTGPRFVGRVAELRRLREAIAGAAAGRGGALRIVGTAGMGKTALLDAALRDVPPDGCRIGRAVGDELARRTPFGVLLECVESALSGDPTRHLAQRMFAAAGDALSGDLPGAVARAIEVIRDAATATPLVLVVDDLECADDATLRAWAGLHRLTADLPLLLIGAGAPPSGDRLGDPGSLPAETIVLPRLDPAESTALVRALSAGLAEPPELHDVLRDAGGNPYYLRHLTLAARPAGDGTTPPPAVVAAVTAHLDPFPDDTRQALRAVAFLCAEHAGSGDEPECTVSDVTAVTEQPEAEVRRALAVARAAGVLGGSGTGLRFRHRIVGRVLRDGTPTALRIMVHRSFAERLAVTGAPPERVAGQLLAGPVPLDNWASRWLTTHVEDLAARAPEPAIAVLHLARGQHTVDDECRLVVTAWLARLLFRQERNATAEGCWVAARTTDPELEAEMRWIVAAAQGRQRDYAAAAETVRTVLSERRLPEHWLDRFRILLAWLRPHLPGDPTSPRMSRSLLAEESVSVGR
ncbi:BTAD domain-containing putative transcriptional regulator [Jidongwangia harbinensis]|uniref:BTAD domain-containing putative transcriptional regulator n=1 Tax=Jidongwangia harbinensis TaxID=2878561 RepID=UPI001CD9DB3A|nr:BTAD domain-containing putative transcriptional regulator [Jidongwangia harbinensis]MCA2211855.1 AAA family ATPase [Jidongwangia harbinensis]